jgi:hypothetical protein
MSPADFCELAGNTGNPRKSIVMTKTRQTLAHFEASARALARMRKPRLVASDLVASAATKAASRWVPELGSFVTVLMPHDLGAAALSPATALPARDNEQQQQQQQQEEPTQGPQRERVEQVQTHQQPHAHQDVHTLEDNASPMWQRLLAAGSGMGAELKKGEIAQGILVGRSSDGWYQVLLVEVIPPHQPTPTRARSEPRASTFSLRFVVVERTATQALRVAPEALFVCQSLCVRVAKTTETSSSPCLMQEKEWSRSRRSALH